MAFSIEVLAVRWERGQYVPERVTGDAGGWRGARELMRDPRFRDLSSQAGYLDYAAVLSVNETLALAQAAAPEQVSALAESLAGAAFVLVHIFEWESGL